MTNSGGSQIDIADAVMAGVSSVFESLGRALICLSTHFQVVHTSDGVDRLFGQGAGKEMLGKQAQEVLGDELFGTGGSMRKALAAGERREGWGATVRVGQAKPRLVSISGAPMRHPPGTPCDPRVAYVIVVRSGESERGSGDAQPTIFSGMVARSPSMLKIFRLIQHLEESDATVLLTGESGTGKELVARAIHVHSHRRNKPFVAVNCGALPGELLESELFGHVRGAFTGAIRDREGRFEAAAGGTLFLDEVGDLPLALQVKLLRVLQEKTFERVGETEPRSSEARVVAATNRHLKEAVAAGDFRDDLYYRLRVVPIEVPPLRERVEDIAPLTSHLLARVNARHNRNLRLSPDAMRLLWHHDWPGNVRELENTLEYAVALTQGQTILPTCLPEELGGGQAAQPTVAASGAGTGAEQSAPGADSAERQDEREEVLAALEKSHWRRGQAASELGISRTTLWRRMRELGLSN
ncbi:MAG: sigma-54-dependent Fis family transcriptional regulator [Acidobacteriota bacterium]|nr:sigma-54-dependent Fis family transcriptional regulator [Acidobacteriota bacterium]